MNPFELTLALYAVALASYAALIFARTGKNGWVPGVFSRLGWLAHSYALLGHPPGVGMFEALVFFPWALITAQVFVEFKLRWRWTGFFSVLLAVAGLGLALLIFAPLGAPIGAPAYEPAPVLQHHWIWLHATSGALSYGFFLISAFFAIFYLIKDGIESDFLLSAVSGLLMGVLLVFFKDRADSWIWRLTLIAAAAQLACSRLALSWEKQQRRLRSQAVKAQAARKRRGLQIVTAPVPRSASALLLFQLARSFSVCAWGGGVLLFDSTRPVFAPFAFAALGVLLVLGLAGLGLTMGRERVQSRLPAIEVLDRGQQQTLVWGFALLTINLVSGMVWAYDAWGSVWSWEPKQLWALITWLFYAACLHLRRARRSTAFAALLGFFLVMMTFLGTELTRLGATGLHSFLRGN